MTVATIDFDKQVSQALSSVGLPSWSDAQLRIFRAVVETTGHMIVSATAGSGKTTTLVGIASVLPPGARSRFLAFSKSIATELQDRLPGVDASTIHSYAFGIYRKALGYAKPDSAKLFHITCSHVAANYPYFDWEERTQLVQDILDPFKMARLTRTDWRDHMEMRWMCNERGVAGHTENNLHDYRIIDEVSRWVARSPKSRSEADLSREALNVVSHLKTAGYKNRSRIPASTGWIDFTEQILYPLEYGKVRGENDFILWDEAQDSNQLYYEFIKATLKPGGRIIAVGDNKQNIMGFAGAFLDGMRGIERDLDATTYPLDVSWRLPISHIELANRIFPGTEASPIAKEGKIVQSNYAWLARAIEEQENYNDVMVICRTNAPAIGFAMYLIGQRIPAHVKGRDFGKMLVKIVKKIGVFRNKPRKGLEFTENFIDFVDQWHQKEVQRLISQDAGDRAHDNQQDRRDSVLALYENTDAADIFEFIQDIENLFGEGNGVTVSSIHRSKGLEAPFVAILEFDKFFKNRPNMTEAQLLGEQCVRFVALTRAKETLVLASKDYTSEGGHAG